MDGLDAKSITYRPRTGASRSVKAIVDYPGPGAIGGLAGGSRPILDIYIENSSTSGISSAEVDTGGDKLDVPLRFGLTAARVRVTKIVAQDKAILHIQAQ